MRILKESAIALALVITTVAVGLAAYGTLGVAGAIPLFLLPVLAAAYLLGFWPSVVASIAAFLALNYFFIEPRFTFEVAQAQFWPALVGLLLVSLVVSSLVRQLKAQTQSALRAAVQSQSARHLAESLAGILEVREVLRASCAVLRQTTGLQVAAVHTPAGGGLETLAEAPAPAFDPRACRWAIDTGKMAGPGTGNWPQAGCWIVPLDRLPGGPGALVFGSPEREPPDVEVAHLRGLVDQICVACQRAITLEHSETALRQAREEAIRNALLASIAHDMRTPLTAILGAATSLQRQWARLDDEQRTGLLASLGAEAQHLSSTTENALALGRLQAGAPVGLEWQSLEEIVGVTLARYRARWEPAALRADVQATGRLIRGDASLLAQALSNLIDNALAVQPAGEPVVVRVREDGDDLLLSVRDGGPGFPSGFAVRPLGSLWAGAPDGRGHGLGLMIVQAIAAAHGAGFEWANLPADGAEVTLRFAARDVEGGGP